jgi:LDH2 family malate/lactate/ureidoglycolate dehydrogenase
MSHVERISLPGDNSNSFREWYAREGIPIAAPLLRELDKVADELGAPRLT